MNTLTFSYRNGLDVVPSTIVEDVTISIESINQSIGLYEVSDFRKELLLKMKQRGWSDNVLLDKVSKISITGEKERCGLCLQTGNVSRIYADLLKLQTLFLQNKIKAGVIILPTVKCAKDYTSNAATYERLNRELNIFDQVITVPLVIIGFYN